MNRGCGDCRRSLGWNRPHTYRRQLVKHRKHSHWYWRAVRADRWADGGASPAALQRRCALWRTVHLPGRVHQSTHPADDWPGYAPSVCRTYFGRDPAATPLADPHQSGFAGSKKHMSNESTATNAASPLPFELAAPVMAIRRLVAPGGTTIAKRLNDACPSSSSRPRAYEYEWRCVPINSLQSIVALRCLNSAPRRSTYSVSKVASGRSKRMSNVQWATLLSPTPGPVTNKSFLESTAAVRNTESTSLFGDRVP